MKNNYSIAERNRIVEEHLSCIDKVIRRNIPLMRVAHLNYDDVYQDLAVRLILCVAGFDPDKGDLEQHIMAQLQYEIAAYQERCDYLIHSGSHSPAVMDRWVLKVKGLEEKKQHYEQVLRRELDGLDDEFTTLKFLAQELQIRANNIRIQKAA